MLFPCTISKHPLIYNHDSRFRSCFSICPATSYPGNNPDNLQMWKIELLNYSTDFLGLKLKTTRGQRGKIVNTGKKRTPKPSLRSYRDLFNDWTTLYVWLWNIFRKLFFFHCQQLDLEFKVKSHGSFFVFRKKIHFSLRAGREAVGHQSWVQWWEGQPHNNKYSLLIAFGNHFSVSFFLLSFHISFPFLLSSLFIFSLFYYCPPPHTPQVLLLSCLLILIFIYRFSSFSLPFLCTDGTLQLASHFTSCLTSLQINAFHILSAFFWYNDHNTRRLCKTRKAWLWQRTHTENEEVLTAFYYSRTI